MKVGYPHTLEGMKVQSRSDVSGNHLSCALLMHEYMFGIGYMYALHKLLGATFRTIIGRRMHAHKTVHFQAVASHLPAAWPLFPLARVKPQV